MEKRPNTPLSISWSESCGTAGPQSNCPLLSGLTIVWHREPSKKQGGKTKVAHRISCENKVSRPWKAALRWLFLCFLSNIAKKKKELKKVFFQSSKGVACEQAKVLGPASNRLRSVFSWSNLLHLLSHYSFLWITKARMVSNSLCFSKGFEIYFRLPDISNWYIRKILSTTLKGARKVKSLCHTASVGVISAYVIHVAIWCDGSVLQTTILQHYTMLVCTRAHFCLPTHAAPACYQNTLLPGK